MAIFEIQDKKVPLIRIQIMLKKENKDKLFNLGRKNKVSMSKILNQCFEYCYAEMDKRI